MNIQQFLIEAGSGNVIEYLEQEVQKLCDRFGMDMAETKSWYDGYRFREVGYDAKTGEAFIPNREIAGENAIRRQNRPSNRSEENSTQKRRKGMRAKFCLWSSAMTKRISAAAVRLRHSRHTPRLSKLPASCILLKQYEIFSDFFKKVLAFLSGL